MKSTRFQIVLLCKVSYRKCAGSVRKYKLEKYCMVGELGLQSNHCRNTDLPFLFLFNLPFIAQSSFHLILKNSLWNVPYPTLAHILPLSDILAYLLFWSPLFHTWYCLSFSMCLDHGPGDPGLPGLEDNSDQSKLDWPVEKSLSSRLVF